MSRNMGKKMNKRIRTENSVQAYACVCVCGCACSCGLVQGGASNVIGNKLVAQVATDSITNAGN